MNLAVCRSSLLLAVAATLVLTGCTFGPTPVPTPTADAADSSTPSPTPTVQPEPIDPLTTVTEIVVRPEQLELHDAHSVVVATLSYDAEASAFIGARTTVLGGTPAAELGLRATTTLGRSEPRKAVRIELRTDPHPGAFALAPSHSR